MAEAQDRWHFPHPRLHRGGQLPPCRPTAPRSSRSATLHCLLVLAPAHSSGGRHASHCWPLLGVFSQWGRGAAKAVPVFFWYPTGGQPTANTLALWWLNFGPTGWFLGVMCGAFALKMGGRWGQGQGMRVEGVLSRLCVGEVG